MSRTLSSNTSLTQTLSASGDNPFTVSSGVTINAGGDGVIGLNSSGITWSVNNFGTVLGGNIGIYLSGSGTVSNAGSVSGGSAGIDLASGGYIFNFANATVTGKYAITSAFNTNSLGLFNAGTIRGASLALQIGDSGRITNSSSGTISGNIEFLTSGLLSNAGAITAPGAITGSYNFTVANAGSISTNGIYFGPGAMITNSGKLSGSISISGQGTVVNTGTITGAVSFSGNGADRVVAGPGAVFAGSVSGGAGTNTLELMGGGAGTLNGLGSTFQNFGTVVEDAGATWVLNNTDTLNGTLIVDGTLTNNGLVMTPGSTILVAGGLLNNTSTLANTGAFSTGVTLSSGTVDNTGSISGSAVGVAMTGGLLINEAGGTVRGAGPGAAGVYLGGPVAGTISNAGMISGAQDAVVFSGSTASRLILYPSGTFTGAVAGQSTDTLELAGTTAATLSGFGTAFTGFGAITADAGANWTLNSSDTIAAGVTLTDAGALTNTGSIASAVTLNGTGVLTNTGTIAGGAVGVSVTGAGTVIDSGLITGSTAAISFANNQANRLMLSAGASFQGAVAGGNRTTLELVSSASTGTLSGLGTAFTGFQAILVDSNAAWVTSGGLIGIGITVAAGGSLTNAGAISTPEFSSITQDVPGVTLNGAGSSLTNQAGALIEAGHFAVASTAQNTTVTNAGIIESTFEGVEMLQGGTVTNSGEIDGFGNVGIYFGGAGGTLTNTGTINGGAIGAVQFTGSAADRVILVTPSAVFGGSVIGGSGANTLELAASATGTVSLANGVATALGASFANFTTIAVDQGASWTVGGSGGFSGVANAGTLSGAVTVASGGAVTNTGTMAGGAVGVRLLGSGSLQNQTAATISASTYVVEGNGAGAVITNNGTLNGATDGVVLFDGGSVNNTGVITGAANIGVYISGAAGTLTNSGTINGGAGGAVLFAGAANNRLILLPGGVLNGRVTGGVGSNTLELAQGASVAIGTLNGFGTSIANFGTVLVDAGSSWQFNTGDSFAAGVLLEDSGLLINATTIGAAVTILPGGTVFNNGSIAGAPDGLSLVNGGTVSNAAAGSISGSSYGIGVSNAPGATFITNIGTITGGLDGVALFGRDTLVNAGVLTGTANFGVYGKGGDTVTNSGTIRGAADAVDLTGGNNRLIITPEAVFSGKVLGGGVTNTLELAASSAAATGTLVGFGGSIAGFPTITIDPGASWAINSSGQLGGDLLITDSGTLSNAGLIGSTVSVASSGSLQNSGTIATSGTAVLLLGSGGGFSNNPGALVNSGVGFGVKGLASGQTVSNGGQINAAVDGVVMTGGGVVTNSGSITGANNVGVYFSGGNGTLTNSGVITGGASGAVQFVGSFADRVIVTPEAVFQGTVSGGSGSNTLELAADSFGATGRLLAQNGLLFGLATTFSSFGTIVVDQGASWLLDDVSAVASTVNQGTLTGVVSIATAGELDNSGSLVSTGNGVRVLGSGAVSNAASGVVSGGRYGVYDAAAGATITNAGRITGAVDGAVLFGAGTLVNSGVLTGTGNIGIYLAGGAATVTNSGTIAGGNFAAEFVGNFADRLILQPGATFSGKVAGGAGSNTLELAAGSAGSTGALTGFGPSFTNFATIVVDQGASWLLDASDTVAATVTLTDSGTLKTTGTVGATVTVAGTGTLDNSGRIAGSLLDAVRMGGGSFINEAAGTITGNHYSVEVRGAAATITNAGVIGATHDGVVLFAGGSVSNTGSISGGNNIGVYITGGAGTVTNSGTIGGGISGAIQFNGSFADRVILTPGAVEQGLVTGGSGSNTLELAAGTAGATGTLAGFGANFLNFQTVVLDAGANWVFSPSDEIGAGTTLINQSSIAAAFTISAGGLLDNVGSLGGVRLLGAGSLVNAATGTIANGNIAVYDTDGFASVTNSGAISGARDGVVLYDGGAVTNAGIIATGPMAGTGNIGVYIANNGTVTNTGTIAGLADAVLFTGTGASRVLMSAAAVFQGGVVGNNSGKNTLELASAAAGTLSGFGAQFTNFQTIVVDPGATWSFDATDTVGGGSTIVDAGGFISGPVNLAPGGALQMTGGTSQLTIASSAAAAVHMTAFSAVYNGYSTNGTIVQTNPTETISNNYGDGIDASGLGNVIYNAAAITALNDGISLKIGGTVDNLSGGKIQAATGDAIYIQGGGTVTNAGSIVASAYASGADAIRFAGTAADRVILAPGAAFTGAVQGGSGSNVLELSGSAPGTLSNVGSQFLNFSTIQLDNGASWTLNSSDVLANTTMQFLGAGTLEVAGYVPPTASIVFGQSGGTLLLDAPGSFLGVLSGSGLGNTISLGNSATIASVTTSGTSLTLDMAGGTNYALRLSGALPANASLQISSDHHSVSLVAS